MIRYFTLWRIMMKTLGLWLCGLTLALSSQIAISESPTMPSKDMVLGMMKDQMAKTCQDSGMLSCLEVSESDCNKMMNDMLQQCIEPKIDVMLDSANMNAEEQKKLQDEMQMCGDKISEDHGVDPEKGKMCDQKLKNITNE